MLAPADIERALGLWKQAEVYQQFLRKFARDYRLCVAEMRPLAPDAVRSRAHKLRGAASSLVLEPLVEATRALEDCLAAGQDPQAALDALQLTLDQAMARIQAYAGGDAA
jgi:HPt (histidine-containing phosphotransfer) domain-containing protein